MPPSSLATALQPGGTKQRNPGKHSPGWQGWPWLHCQDRSSDLLLRQQVCHPVYWFGGFCGIKLKKKKQLKKRFQYKFCLFQMFAPLWLEVQNKHKHQWTFLSSYNCKFIPFIYPHFMQQVKGKSYKQSLSWKYSPFFTVQLSIVCSGHVTQCSHKSPKAQTLLIYQHQCYLLTALLLLFFFSFPAQDQIGHFWFQKE